MHGTKNIKVYLHTSYDSCCTQRLFPNSKLMSCFYVVVRVRAGIFFFYLFKLVYNICNMPPERYSKTRWYRVIMGHLSMSFLLVMWNYWVQMNVISRKTQSPFMSGYVVRKLIVSRQENAKQYQKLLTIGNKTDPLKIYKNFWYLDTGNRNRISFTEYMKFKKWFYC
jgi:hypothetical protein